MQLRILCETTAYYVWRVQKSTKVWRADPAYLHLICTMQLDRRTGKSDHTWGLSDTISVFKHKLNDLKGRHRGRGKKWIWNKDHYVSLCKVQRWLVTIEFFFFHETESRTEWHQRQALDKHSMAWDNGVIGVTMGQRGRDCGNPWQGFLGDLALIPSRHTGREILGQLNSKLDSKVQRWKVPRLIITMLETFP